MKKNVKETKKMDLEPRICESCSFTEYDELWNYNWRTRTENYNYQFHMRNVICKRCGFIFVPLVPTDESLNKYYSDSIQASSYSRPTYKYEKRIELIQLYKNNALIYADVGADRKSTFHKTLEDMFSKVYCVDLKNSVNAHYKTINELTNKVDILSLYSVLEHIPNLRYFLNQAHEVLRNEGVMICEVPDVQKYHRHISALLNGEHINHFSLNTLTQVASDTGFELIDSPKGLCSRAPLSFVAVFRKKLGMRKKAISYDYREEYKTNKSTFLKGVDKLEEFDRKLKRIYSQLELTGKEGKNSIIWCANDNLQRFLHINKRLPKNAIIVDSDPLKKHYFDNIRVFHPGEVKQQIVDSDTIAIFSDINAGDILKLIKTIYGRTFHKNKLFLLVIHHIN